ncbi:MAG TPA: hypothetical protein VFB44_07480 [Thermoleophilaceae bacterium]|nr:hypothetical protein [Thermoleophilaceae bacterium]
MQYAERLPSVPSPKTVAVPLVALILGAAAATGAYALIDNNEQVAQPPSNVIVLDAPAPASEGTIAKNEAGTAAAIGRVSVPGDGVNAKNEAGTAAAIGRVSAPGDGVNAKNEAGTAAAIGSRSAPGDGVNAKNEAGTAAAISPQ